MLHCEKAGGDMFGQSLPLEIPARHSSSLKERWWAVLGLFCIPPESTLHTSNSKHTAALI